MRLCNYCQAGMAVLPTLEIGQYIFCDAECASKRIAELESKVCDGCDGRGEVGNQFDSEPCPFCNQDGLKARNAELKAKLETVTALARIKYGNLDADVDAVLTGAEKLVASLKA